MGIDYTPVGRFGIRLTRDAVIESVARLNLIHREYEEIEALTDALGDGFTYSTVGSAYSGDEEYIIGPKIEMGEDPNPVKSDHVEALKAAVEKLGYGEIITPRWHIDLHIW